tara:strand:- start:2237 stop:2410 length:174 start_codon:yes stop_codon:yes gene_type:complete
MSSTKVKKPSLEWQKNNNIKVKIEVSLDLAKNNETHRSMEEINIKNQESQFSMRDSA